MPVSALRAVQRAVARTTIQIADQRHRRLKPLLMGVECALLRALWCGTSRGRVNSSRLVFVHGDGGVAGGGIEYFGLSGQQSPAGEVVFHLLERAEHAVGLPETG